MYAMFSGGLAPRGAIAALGPYELPVISADDTWIPGLHKFHEVLLSQTQSNQTDRDTSLHFFILLF